MLLSLFIKRFIYSATFYVTYTIVAFCSFASSFVSVENLNFETKLKSGLILNSGPRGNIYIWNPSFINEEERNSANQKKFDISVVHQDLHREEEEIRKSWGRAKDNVVTAAFTLIFEKKDSNYYATTKIFSKGIKSKKGREEKTLAFTSGTEGRAGLDYFIDATTYSLSDLFESALKRSKQFLFINSPELQSLIKNIETIQKEKVQAAFDVVQNSKDILEIEKKLRDFDNLVKNSRYKRTGGYGPIADSEQFLLHYLEEKLICNDLELKTPKGIYMDLLQQHVEDQTNHLKKNSKPMQDIENCKPIGAILHVHSTREFCNFCATSLLDEFYYEEGNFVSRLKEDMKNRKDIDEASQSEEKLPFFAVLGSYREFVDQSGNQLRPKGTKSGDLIRKLEEGDISNEMINLEKIIEKKILPLFQFT